MAGAIDPLIESSQLHLSIPSPSDVDAAAISSAERAARDGRSTALRLAVGEAVTRSAETMLTLRVAVTAFTADLRDRGMLPEAVLIALKKIVMERTDAAGVLMRDQICTWCIKEFFAEHANPKIEEQKQ
ncbi:MAG TPA: hypothetical protein VF887_07560 [Gemmatimonadaceae bacterium]